MVRKKSRGCLARDIPRVGSVPPYFNRQSRLPNPVDKPSEEETPSHMSAKPVDKLYLCGDDGQTDDMPESLVGILAELRAKRALQLIVEIADFCKFLMVIIFL